LRRNCLLQWVIEGKIQGGIEVTRRQGRRHMKLMDDLKERRGYYHLKEEYKLEKKRPQYLESKSHARRQTTTKELELLNL
jgi:hypothetical protein